ncbi:Cellulose synthase-like protein G3 [Linum grandiflorum]
MEDNPTTGRRSSVVLHTAERWPITTFNRLFAPVYLLAILALFYHHATTLLLQYYSTSASSFFITLTLLLADVALAFMWAATQVFRMSPIRRREMVSKLDGVVSREELPGLDVFVCTADPYKEPPIGVVNTALSVMAYDYPKDKLAVYVSDDGGSELTLFAFVEAAKFAAVWLPFCERNRMVERNPAAYFESGDFGSSSGEAEEIKNMYETMKMKVEQVVERGKVDDKYINGPKEKEAFSKWSHKFTKQDHPSVIQVLVESKKDKDVDGQIMPNLIYVSRQKSRSSPHHFKAGALNVLLRVSATMTNAPIILTLDCDMYSNDPRTPLRTMCYFCDPKLGLENSAYVQFPQKYRGINKNDIYAGEYARLFVIQAMGFDGLCGPNHVGTGCFFRRRVFFGGPLNPVPVEIPDLEPDHVVRDSVQSDSVLGLADEVSSCDYENRTGWGSKIGFRYGSLVEDYYTGYRLHCEGWRSIFCSPDRPAFLGDAPISLVDMINQQKRWDIGLLEVAFSKFSTLTHGVKRAGFLVGLGYSQYAFWPVWSIPLLVYSFVPQLALLNNVHIFPKATEPWFWLYPFLFLGAYTQDLLDFLIVGGTIPKWWSDQRIWLLRGLTCHLFGSVEYVLKFIGIAAGFNVTSKVLDEEQSKRYDQGIFEFGVHSPMFVAPTVAAFINLLALLQYGVTTLVLRRDGDALPVVELLVAGFGVVNCWPIYEAVGLRSDKGKMPLKTTVLSAALALACYVAAPFVL